MEMMVVICDRSQTKKVMKILEETKISYHVSFYGKGTASNEILSYFGLAKSEKEVIVSFVYKDQSKEAMMLLNRIDHIKGHGAVAFCIPMDAVGKSTLDYMSN